MLLLRLLAPPSIPIEAECLAPDRLLGKSAGEVAALTVLYGNLIVPVGDLFQVSGDPADGAVVVEGECARVKRLGAGMTAGKLTIRGNAGMHLGADMTGGDIRVEGNADDWVGAEMRGGHIHVRGNAGNLVGAAYRGAPVGMRGGVILVEGKAGHEVGVNMRRGTIAVGGDVGDFAGMAMLAGTLLVFGQTGGRPGAAMKRGTVAVFGGPPRLLPTFRYDCVYEPVFLRIYLRQLRSWGFPVSEEFFGGVCRRYSGDHVALGKGELLHWMQEMTPAARL